jgi:hypothetical protein
MAIQKLKLGDVFYIEAVKGKFVFGKVLFDVDTQYRKKESLQKTDLINSSNNLQGWYAQCLLIEMYTGVYDDSGSIFNRDVLIKRAMCSISGLKNRSWGIITNEQVNVKQVSFPETLVPSNNSICIDFGELEFKTNFTEDDYDELGVSTDRVDIISIANVCFNMQGFSNLLKEDYQKDESMAMYDLMYHPSIRNKIYKELNLDPDKSYYELSKELGFDLKRFYE